MKFFVAVFAIALVSSASAVSNIADPNTGAPAGATYGLTTASGLCPSVQYQLNVDIASTQNFYYFIQSTIPATTAGCTGNCWTTNVVRYSNTTVTNDHCCNKNGATFCGSEIGSGNLTTMAQGSGNWDFYALNNDYNFALVRYSPGQYVLVYGCATVNGAKQDLLVILSAQQTLSASIVSQLRAAAVQNNLTISNLVDIPQNCNNYMGPKAVCTPGVLETLLQLVATLLNSVLSAVTGAISGGLPVGSSTTLPNLPISTGSGGDLLSTLLGGLGGTASGGPGAVLSTLLGALGGVTGGATGGATGSLGGLGSLAGLGPVGAVLSLVLSVVGGLLGSGGAAGGVTGSLGGLDLSSLTATLQGLANPLSLISPLSG